MFQYDEDKILCRRTFIFEFKTMKKDLIISQSVKVRQIALSMKIATSAVDSAQILLQRIDSVAFHFSTSAVGCQNAMIN